MVIVITFEWFRRAEERKFQSSKFLAAPPPRKKGKTPLSISGYNSQKYYLTQCCCIVMLQLTCIRLFHSLTFGTFVFSFEIIFVLENQSRLLTGKICLAVKFLVRYVNNKSNFWWQTELVRFLLFHYCFFFWEKKSFPSN